MIKLCKDWVYDYYKKKIFKFTVAYMILGVLIFTFSNFQLSYINMIYYVMGHPYLIAFFLTPVILFTTVSILSEFMANKNLALNSVQCYNFQFLSLKNLSATIPYSEIKSL